MCRLTLLLVFLTACTSRPVMQGDGSTPAPTPGDRPKPTEGCHEIARSRCDAARCKGTGMDSVVYQCPSGQVERCEMSKTDCQ